MFNFGRTEVTFVSAIDHEKGKTFFGSTKPLSTIHSIKYYLRALSDILPNIIATLNTSQIQLADFNPDILAISSSSISLATSNTQGTSDNSNVNADFMSPVPTFTSITPENIPSIIRILNATNNIDYVPYQTEPFFLI